MTHQVDGLLDLHHGETNAALLPHVMEFNLISCAEKYGRVAEALGENVAGLNKQDRAESAIVAVQRLVRDIGIRGGLSAMGLKEEYIPALSQNALNDACLVTNPRDADAEDLARIFRKAL